MIPVYGLAIKTFVKEGNVQLAGSWCFSIYLFIHCYLLPVLFRFLCSMWYFFLDNSCVSLGDDTFISSPLLFDIPLHFCISFCLYRFLLFHLKLQVQSSFSSFLQLPCPSQHPQNLPLQPRENASSTAARQGRVRKGQHNVTITWNERATYTNLEPWNNGVYRIKKKTNLQSYSTPKRRHKDKGGAKKTNEKDGIRQTATVYI